MSWTAWRRCWKSSVCIAKTEAGRISAIIFCWISRVTIYEGRDLHARGAHTAGYNTGSAGICLMGDFRFVAPSRAQLDAAQALIRWLVYRLHPTHLAGHQDFNQTTACPGSFLIDQLEALAAAVGLELGIDGFRPAARSADHCGCCGCQTHL